MRSVRPIVLALVAAALAAPAAALPRDTFRTVKGRYEGLVLRLRVDLKEETGAHAPNVVGRGGIGYGRERAPVLFGRMEKVFIDRITNEGAKRLSLTVYRDQKEALRIRASAVPGPTFSNPNYPQTVASFAQLGSTTVLLELEAGKDDPDAQLAEIETLLDRVFFLKSEPDREEMEAFVRQHRGLSIQRLKEITDLDGDTIRALIREPEAAPSPAAGPATAPAPSASPSASPPPPGR